MHLMMNFDCKKVKLRKHKVKKTQSKHKVNTKLRKLKNLLKLYIDNRIFH